MTMPDEHHRNDTFLQSCDVCGRPTIIPRYCSGQGVGCRHCGGEFLAAELAMQIVMQSNDSGDGNVPEPWRLMKRARSFDLRMIQSLAASMMAAISNLLSEMM